jgi:hypothetical protein
MENCHVADAVHINIYESADLLRNALQLIFTFVVTQER